MNYALPLAAISLLNAAPAAHAELVDCSVVLAERTIDGGGDNSVCSHFGGGVDTEFYIDWYNGNKIAEKYPGYTFLQGSDPDDPDSGVAVHWAIDGQYLHLAVAARATGWVGFGLAEAGGMLGTDMVLFEAASPDVLIDAYTTDEKIPITDECASDWERIDSKAEHGFLFFETRRLLDTGDDQDRVIIDDESTLIPPHRVIAAWGDSETVSFHGLNRARGMIRFFGTEDNQALFDLEMGRHAEGSFLVRSLNHEIAARETEYFETCVNRVNMISQGLPISGEKKYLIGVEPFVQPGNEAYVHHYVITGYATSDCPRGNERFLGETVFAWAPGMEPWALPDFLGIPFNGVGEFNSFVIEVHYNNIQRKSGVRDSSGVRFYWTSQPREVEMGVFTTGDIFVALGGRPVGAGLSNHQFECPSSCSEAALQDQAVTVVREYLHMHRTGVRITNEQIRDGEVIRTGVLDFWDFDQNGNGEVLQEAFVVEPGDSFRTNCYYDAPAGTTFGIGSQEEMCMAFLAYYPKVKPKVDSAQYGFNFGLLEVPWVCGYGIPIPLCRTAYEQSALSVDELGRTFGIPADECPVPEELSSTDDEGGVVGSDDETDDVVVETDDVVGSTASRSTNLCVSVIGGALAGLLIA